MGNHKGCPYGVIGIYEMACSWADPATLAERVPEGRSRGMSWFPSQYQSGYIILVDDKANIP